MWLTRRPAFVAIALLVFFAETGNAADWNASFERAGREFGVPLEIVRGVAHVSSGGVQRQPSTFADRPPAYGVMGLRDDEWFGHSLREAAALLGVSPELLRTDAEANIRDVDSWRGVVAEFSGIPQQEIADLFAQQVLDTIHPAVPAAKAGRTRRIASLANTSCAGVVWYGDTIPTTNYDSTGRAGVAVDKVVIHTTEETAAATLSIFQDPAPAERWTRSSAECCLAVKESSAPDPAPMLPSKWPGECGVMPCLTGRWLRSAHGLIVTACKLVRSVPAVT